ncbi:hypothetical protein FOA43_001646 [Brettanomyces nanus]|uniref:Golgi apyrase n=1 Tax=Eeniella nana TaxID=13502 RepID=A0A875S3D8_EENNA|nr:uncharacterized protein FOA43_001646 [Brettanomyces nanus]QPG74319.1 hypothetical protein FOA43_001646 [Brettanomyces nanus]
MSDRYGIVVDAGSSGSRLQIYRWTDPATLASDKSSPSEVLHSVPNIIQEKEWGYRVNPGLSSYAKRPWKIWNSHLKPLIKFAETIIPEDKQKDTPIFIQATAGMRLLPEKQRNKILSNTCDSIRHHSKFQLNSCKDQIQVIDGDTEGIYGWMALNYLEDKFENFDSSNGINSHATFGFMDMGGASTQIAFVPSKESEREKHSNELYTVRLRNVDGSLQEWPVFVSSWLGFGANEARRRHLRNLIMSLPEGVNYDTNGDSTYDISDPCSQKGMKIQQKYKDIAYDITGSGDYKQCLRTIYPLLLKHLPCKEDSCLFNGVSAPAIDFDKDRFVGISEYWYTANDVFHMAGDYNFKDFEQRLKGFCEADWSQVEQNYENGKYGGNIQIPLLRDCCFKASWVVNVLHEGFGLPRIGFEADDSNNNDNNNYEDLKPAFQSVNTIKGAELSWTLGKILLYASSQTLAPIYSASVGVYPSEAYTLKVEEQRQADYAAQRDRESLFGLGPWWVIVLFIFSIMGIGFFLVKKHPKSKNLLLRMSIKLQAVLTKFKSHATSAYSHIAGGRNDLGVNEETQELSELEEGRFMHHSDSAADLRSSTLRTRSTANLQDLKFESFSPSPSSPPLSSRNKSQPGIPHSQSFSTFPLRAGCTSDDLMSKRFPSPRYPSQNTKLAGSLQDFMSLTNRQDR